jgi:heme iron utilization protein
VNDEARRHAAIRLLSEQLWFALATVYDNGVPTISYIPFAIVGGAFGIVVSRLAAHSAPLLAGSPASVLLVDADAPLADAYTRARFSIAVRAWRQAAGSEAAGTIWSSLENRQGAIVRTLRALPDFDAISLEPVEGRLVLGFASAHDLSAATIVDLLENAR